MDATSPSPFFGRVARGWIIGLLVPYLLIGLGAVALHIITVVLSTIDYSNYDSYYSSTYRPTSGSGSSSTSSSTSSSGYTGNYSRTKRYYYDGYGYGYSGIGTLAFGIICAIFDFVVVGITIFLLQRISTRKLRAATLRNAFAIMLTYWTMALAAGSYNLIYVLLAVPWAYALGFWIYGAVAAARERRAMLLGNPHAEKAVIDYRLNRIEAALGVAPQPPHLTNGTHTQDNQSNVAAADGRMAPVDAEVPPPTATTHRGKNVQHDPVVAGPSSAGPYTAGPTNAGPSTAPRLD